MRLSHRAGALTRSQGLSDEERDQLLLRAARAEAGPAPADAADGDARVATIDLAAPAGAAPGRLRAAVGGVLRAPLGLEVVLVVAGEQDASMAPLWLGSLLRHVSLCASHLLLRDVDRERREQQEDYLRRVLGAQEDERSRVARDLHDTVAQDLAALRLEIERVASHSPSEVHRGELDRLEARAGEMLDTVRRILLDLRLSVLESMGLMPALRWLLERTEREHGVRGQLVIDGDEAIAIGYQRSVALFRILQEALLNVVHHAGAENVFATVGLRPDAVELTVEDDGRGFDVATLGAPRPEGRSHGLGIIGMEERARLFGGTLEVSSSAGEGTTIRARVPLPAEDRA
jgi:signal transduction histidine kinase